MRILVIDDHELFGVGLTMLLEHVMPGVQVERCTSAAQGLVLLQAGHAFELVMLDWHIPGENVGVLLGAMKSQLSCGRVVMLSADCTPKVVAQCMELGADGFIGKASSSEWMVNALAQVMKGHVVLPPVTHMGAAAPSVLGLTDKGELAPAQAAELMASRLTDRQRAVLMAMSKGLSNKQIGSRLGITEDTVKQHLAVVYAALGVHGRTGAMYWLARYGVATA